ncbi:MAG: 2-iminoacetate synthase ThiH [Verrucomicrobiae bacterium]|nr:2-iminoacetate synthase ThiH [Verrucomicrobiae bacterium]
MSFKLETPSLPVLLADTATTAEVETALSRSRRTLEDFAALISPAAAKPALLEAIAHQAHELTVRHFGRVIRLFAPLYVSNECVNFCRYCGFSRNNPVQRKTLTLEDVLAEASYLRQEGFRHLLLVSGEHPVFASTEFLTECVEHLHPNWPSISLEVGPRATAEYAQIVRAGADGLVIYQETYDRGVYAAVHPAGPKKDFDWRLETPERGYAAGFKRLGVGILLGLAPWRKDALALAAHVAYLQRHCWKSHITASIPRLRPTIGGFEPPVEVTDRDLVQLVCALRLTFPQIGIVLSTRERASLRNGLIPLGITMMSAGSRTHPGGYFIDLHCKIASEGEYATDQFEVADLRSPKEVASALAALGYEPVWKDWDSSLNE